MLRRNISRNSRTYNWYRWIGPLDKSSKTERQNIDSKHHCNCCVLWIVSVDDGTYVCTSTLYLRRKLSLILSSPNRRQHSTHLYGVIAQKEYPPERARSQKCEMFVLCYGYCNCHHKFSYEWFLFPRFVSVSTNFNNNNEQCNRMMWQERFLALFRYHNCVYLKSL